MGVTRVPCVRQCDLPAPTYGEYLHLLSLKGQICAIPSSSRQQRADQRSFGRQQAKHARKFREESDLKVEKAYSP